MIDIKLATLTEYAQGQFVGKKEESEYIINNITTDSREAKCGSVFACIRGEKTDGHKYASKAAENGAVALICEEVPKDCSIPCILVDSTLTALQNIARSILKETKVKVVGIGGSVGKTSTKEMIASVLSVRYNVLKTSGNHNNELGLPLTVFEIQKDTQVAVLEMGIDDFGQMHKLASIARPDICVLTNIGDCHLENLGDRDGVLKAKSEMFDFLEPDGHVVLCGDDERLAKITDVKGIRPVHFGTSSGNDVRAVSITYEGIVKSEFTVKGPNGDFKAVIHKQGEYMVRNALAGAAVGFLMGLDNEEIAEGLFNYRSMSGRFNAFKTEKFTVIDDCYNANPMSMCASLSTLSEIKTRKVAILGDMGELGADEIKFHEEVGKYAAGCKIDVLLCVGERSASMASAASCNKELIVRHFDTKEKLMEELPQILNDGDTILVKASHFMEFGRIVEMIKTL